MLTLTMPLIAFASTANIKWNHLKRAFLAQATGEVRALAPPRNLRVGLIERLVECGWKPHRYCLAQKNLSGPPNLLVYAVYA